jgi:phosphoenolpyruvate carboxylase
MTVRHPIGDAGAAEAARRKDAARFAEAMDAALRHRLQAAYRGLVYETPGFRDLLPAG